MEYLKKLIHQKIKEFFPRAYYLLAWNNEQFAVYYGQEYPTTSCTVGCVGGGSAIISSTGPRTVLMWNAEYNTYGNGSNINLTYKYNSDGTWKKYYNINDHLGNVRTVLQKDGTTGTIVKQFDYAPFGAVLNSTDIKRTKFIGKEKDKESNYADHGVRKYDDEIGRFTSIDPLWEKYYSLTPYQYAGNNPVSFLDGNGMEYYVGIDGTMLNREVKDKDDPTVYLVEGSGEEETLTNIGKKGGIIDASKILEYILEKNIEIAKDLDATAFYRAVKNKGGWDIKSRSGLIFGSENFKNNGTLFSFKKSGWFGNKSLIMESQDVGNFHFGVVGKANDIFSEKILLMGAGLAQIVGGTSTPDWWWNGKGIYGGSHGDDPRDQWYIKLGFDYFKKGK